MIVPAAGDHGGDAAAVAASLGIGRVDLIDLSMSMNPLAPEASQFVARALDEIHVYPDATSATHRVAEAIGVDAERLVMTNGGSEAIALVAASMDAGNVVDPEFSLYRRHLRTVRPDAPRWRSNPSNPLGRLAPTGSHADVWDEAFFPLATGRWTDPAHDAVWRLGSLAKLWSCPGLRIGYVIAPDPVAARSLAATQPRWSVNGLALAVVEPMLDETDLATWSGEVGRMRDRFADEIRRSGFVVENTDANWILVRAEFDLRGALTRHGVVVRDCANFGLSDTFRVAVPRPEHVDRVLHAVGQVATERRLA